MAHLMLSASSIPASATGFRPASWSELSTAPAARAGDAEGGRARVAAHHPLRAQYLVDIDRWGYVDPRLAPQGKPHAARGRDLDGGHHEDGPRDAIGEAA